MQVSRKNVGGIGEIEFRKDIGGALSAKLVSRESVGPEERVCFLVLRVKCVLVDISSTRSSDSHRGSWWEGVAFQGYHSGKD